MISYIKLKMTQTKVIFVCSLIGGTYKTSIMALHNHTFQLSTSTWYVSRAVFFRVKSNFKEQHFSLLAFHFIRRQSWHCLMTFFWAWKIREQHLVWLLSTNWTCDSIIILLLSCFNFWNPISVFIAICPSSLKHCEAPCYFKCLCKQLKEACGQVQ